MAASWKMQNILSFLSTFLCQNVANHRQDPLLPSLAVIKQALPSKPLCGKTPTKYRKETIADLIPCRHQLSDHCQGKLVTVTKQHSRWALIASPHTSCSCTYGSDVPRGSLQTCAHHIKFWVTSGNLDGLFVLSVGMPGKPGQGAEPGFPCPSGNSSRP